MSPLCESFVPADRLERMEPFYPLHVRACTRCWLVQLPAFVPPEEIFTEYAYFSGYSAAWVEHARAYVEMIRARLELGETDLVVELASNDGYLLQHFVGTGVPILGIDPAANVAAAAEERGVPTLVEFFGRETAERLAAEGRRASLVVGNNVLAQVPDLNDFVAGVKIVLRDEGTATFEFPHLLQLLDGLQYDTIYHEHFSYFSLGTIVEILSEHGLDVYDVEELWTHGGSLRVYAQQRGGPHPTRDAVPRLLADEEREGLRSPERYARFAEKVKESKRAPRSPDRSASRREADRRLRSSRQGQHAPQLLRHSNRLPRLHGRPESVQARPLHAGDSHPDPPGGADRRDASRLPARAALEPHRRDLLPARVRRRMGWEADRPDPAGHGHRAG